MAVALLAGDEGSKVMEGTEDKRRTKVNRVVGVSSSSNSPQRVDVSGQPQYLRPRLTDTRAKLL